MVFPEDCGVLYAVFISAASMLLSDICFCSYKKSVI